MEQNILLITNYHECMEPLQAVMRTILQHSPCIISPGDVARRMETSPVDLVVIDIRSGDGGVEMIRQLKHHYPMVQLIALVPYGDLMLVESALIAGADDYIAQPISLERLKTTLRNSLRIRSLVVRGMQDNQEFMAYVGAQPPFALSIFYKKAGQLRTLREIEDMAIGHAISSCSGCITKAARALGIGRSTLYRKMQENGGADNYTKARLGSYV